MRLQEYSANGTPVAAAIDSLRAEPVDAACDWFSLEHLARGSERVGGMVVRSAQVRKLLKTISRLSPYKATVLIHGESGTGKELVARALHTLGSAPGGPFVTFNCSNLVETLAESQLFGHVRGAFTDAREDSLGYFRSANGGTLFLDEIGELPLRLQPKLLRAVETHEIQPVGSSRSYSVDIRLVAATNRDLRAMVKAGQFRDDLYYRLNAAAILVPPLRERREAIPAFVAHFIEHYNRLFGKNVKEVSRAALDALRANQWLGNVRELGHAIESAVLMTETDRIDLDDLPFQHDDATPEAVGVPANAMLPNGALDLVEGGSEGADSGAKEWPYSLDAVIREASKLALIRALQATEGNCHRAAELLGVSRYTVYRMLNRFGLAEGRTYRTFRKPTARRA
jgi:DNA-binding NtrC family response regulator